jgi:hypothetical protein
MGSPAMTTYSICMWILDFNAALFLVLISRAPE